MSSLDPSMLLGFLIQDENDWQDFVERMNNVSDAAITVVSCQADDHDFFSGPPQDLLHSGTTYFLE
jgi:hypothetical protein